MSEFELSAALTILGALIGAVIAPACELLILRKFETDISRMKTGFVLLCSANALWLLSSPLMPLVQHHPFWLVLVALLYAISALFFIGSFRAFQVIDREEFFPNFAISIRYLALGNFLWIVAEMSELPLAYFQLDELPYLLIKHALYVPTLICFAKAALASKSSSVES